MQSFTVAFPSRTLHFSYFSCADDARWQFRLPVQPSCMPLPERRCGCISPRAVYFCYLPAAFVCFRIINILSQTSCDCNIKTNCHESFSSLFSIASLYRLIHRSIYSWFWFQRRKAFHVSAFFLILVFMERAEKHYQIARTCRRAILLSERYTLRYVTRRSERNRP